MNNEAGASLRRKYGIHRSSFLHAPWLQTRVKAIHVQFHDRPRSLKIFNFLTTVDRCWIFPKSSTSRPLQKCTESRRVKPKRSESTREPTPFDRWAILISMIPYCREGNKNSTVIAVDLVALGWRHLLISKQGVSYRPHIISLTRLICAYNRHLIVHIW